MSHFKAENAPNSISAGARPQTPLGELTALPPGPLAGFKGGLLLREREGRKGEKRGGERGREGKREGKGKEGKGKGRGRKWTPQGFCEMTPLKTDNDWLSVEEC